ncbi:MAG TPA: MFS transporter [Oscillospiraceae bacterium]|nr:MFS transporter [Oscillospiraceae bacterium]HPS35547.1 MFS transporter [Oscillospiraceae bacterium]
MNGTGKKLTNSLTITSLFVINAGVYTLFALFYCFVQLFLGTIHTPVEVGALLSFGQAAAVISPLLFGMAADKSKHKNTILLITMAGSAVCYFAMTFSNSFLWHAVTIAATLCFLAPSATLNDTITLEYTYRNQLKYGTIRVMGTIAYGIVACVLTLFIKDDYTPVFLIFIAVTVINCFTMLFTPKVEGQASKKKLSLRPLFKDKILMWMFLFIGIINFCWSYYQNFFPSYLINDLGAPKWVWGLNVLLTVVGEIPFFLLFTGLFRRYGSKKLMWISLVLTAGRYIMLGFFMSPSLLLFAGVITGVSISSSQYCASVYITENIPGELQASAQTLMCALPAGAPKILAGILGGVLTQTIGTKTSLLICSALGFISMAVYFMTLGKKSVVYKSSHGVKF